MLPTLPKPLELPELIDQLPNICGWEAEVAALVQQDKPVFLSQSNLQFEQIRAGFAIALHMHQPTIPGGSSGELISNLQYMFEHPQEGDNHNAAPFAHCYARMGEIIPDLVNRGYNPRVMLDYSGNLLWGLRQMGRGDVLDALSRITCDPTYQPYVEWLGTCWSHAVITSTPIADLKLQIQAWQHHFAALFGGAALARVKGFSPPEMHLPNHPDTLYAYVKALLECGYRWLLVQEHSVETPSGEPLQDRHLPHCLVARNSQGQELRITAVIKTQGSDTKLVAQMQPYYEAKTLQCRTVNGISIPPLVTQIGDGENGGVMMNEFPGGFERAWQEMAADVVGMNGTEYLELLQAAGVTLNDLPPCQPIGQHRIWQKMKTSNPTSVETAIADLQKADPSFALDGASWTNHLSWVEGYENVLNPMYQLSANFHRRFDSLVEKDPTLTQSKAYRQALLYNLLLQTSCFRYWGQGAWTDFAQEIFRRGEAALAA
jgi:hypothetical protein